MAENTIWFNKELQQSELHKFSTDTMALHLGMEWVAVGADYLRIKMPVDERTKQPYGLLHGGASCALAETAGSMASYCVIDPAKNICVGIEINANHIRGVKQGSIIATVTPLHLGATTHVWDIKIHDDSDKLVCVSRLTVAILPKKQ